MAKAVPSLTYVLDREACLISAADSKPLAKLCNSGSNLELLTLSCIRKAIKRIQKGVLWSAVEALGVSCFKEDIAFYQMCGQLRQMSNVFSLDRANFEDEKLQVIAVARLGECVIVTGDSSTSASSMAGISGKFAVTVHKLHDYS